MEKEQVKDLLKRMLREQLCCLGRIFARHEVADDAIWDVVKGFDLIHQRFERRTDDSE